MLMGFSDRQKKFFFHDLGFKDNREISRAMDYYSEHMIGRYINSNDISITWILKINEFLGEEADFNYLIKGEESIDKVAENEIKYKRRNLELIDEIESKLKEIKNNMSPK